jgi:hypothetical protein
VANSPARAVNAPFHPNERQTLIDRISNAATNARNFARGGAETARVLYIRLHEDADIATYSSCVGEFFRDEPDHPLGAVLLYQPAQVQTLNADGSSTSRLQHTLVEVDSPCFPNWKAASPFRKPGLTLPIRTVSNRPARHVIQHERGQRPLQPGYFYQSGNFYSLRGLEGTHVFGTVAPGLRQHVVIVDPVGGMTVSLITSPDGRFTLFD